MATSPTQDGAGLNRSWKCECCQARLGSAVAPGACPLCGGSLCLDGRLSRHPTAIAVGVRHDRAAFARAALAFIAACRDIPDEVVASVVVPEGLLPLYVPFRRMAPAVDARLSGGADAGRAGSAGATDICMAPGLDARERAALATIAAAHAVNGIDAAPPAGPILLSEIDAPPGAVAGARLAGGVSSLDPHHLALAATRTVDYLVPVWVLALPWPARPQRLLMDAGAGCIVGLAPADASPSRPPARIEVIGHWAWVPALFCLLLASLIEVAVVRGALGALAAATLAGGYFAAGKLRSGLARARIGLAAALHGTAGDRIGNRLGDPAHARRRLVAMQRVVAWLPGTYAGIALCAHLGVTAYVAENPVVLRAESPQAASFAPRSTAGPNPRVSPPANPRGSRAGMPGPVGSGTARVLPPTTGHPVAAEGDAYRDLAAAVAAPGDSIDTESRRYDGAPDPRRLRIR